MNLRIVLNIALGRFLYTDQHMFLYTVQYRRQCMFQPMGGPLHIGQCNNLHNHQTSSFDNWLYMFQRMCQYIDLYTFLFLHMCLYKFLYSYQYTFLQNNQYTFLNIGHCMICYQHIHQCTLLRMSLCNSCICSCIVSCILTRILSTVCSTSCKQSTI